MLANIAIEDAWRILRNVTVPLKPENTPLSSSQGRVAATDLKAVWDLPANYKSAVDGFVLHNDDLPGDCRLAIGEPLGPGKIPDFILAPGHTVKVGTGGILPEGTAAVIPEEKAEIQGNSIFVKEKIIPGSNIRTKGEDFKKGEIIVRQHERLTPGMLGVLAAFGQEKVLVYRQPSVALICLGPEIIPHHVAPLAGQVRDSNGVLLSSLVARDGGLVANLQYMGRDLDATNAYSRLEETFAKADLIITTGSAYGEFSRLAPTVLHEAGAEMLFWETLSKPGSHSGGAIWQSKPILALSGNAAACAVGYHLLATPVLRKMQGFPFEPERMILPCAGQYKRNGNVRQFLRGRLFIDNGTLKVKILSGQKSSMMKSLLSYNALIDLQAGHAPVKEGSLIPVIPLQRDVPLTG